MALIEIVAFLFLMMGLLDHARARVLARAGARFQAGLDSRVLGAMLSRAGRSPASRSAPARGLHDLEAMQRFASGPLDTCAGNAEASNYYQVHCKVADAHRWGFSSLHEWDVRRRSSGKQWSSNHSMRGRLETNLQLFQFIGGQRFAQISQVGKEIVLARLSKRESIPANGWRKLGTAPILSYQPPRTTLR